MEERLQKGLHYTVRDNYALKPMSDRHAKTDRRKISKKIFDIAIFVIFLFNFSQHSREYLKSLGLMFNGSYFLNDSQ
jgi:hypothetical protein